MIYSSRNNTIDDYLNECTPVNVIPRYASINEMAFHVIESSEADFNRIMIECGVNELDHLEETGMEMVYEEGKLSSLVENVKKAFEEMWKKIQGMFKSVIEFFEKQAAKFRSEVMKKVNKAMVQSRIDNIKKDKNYGTTYEYKDISQYSSDVINKIYQAQEKIKDQYNTLAAKMMAKTEDGDGISVEALDKNIDNAVKKCVSDLVGGATNSTSGMVKTMKSDIRGKQIGVSGKWVQNNMNKGLNILGEVNNFPETKGILKKNYTELKNDFNKTIKECNDEKKKNRSNAAAFTKVAKGWKRLKQITVLCQQAVIGCLSERYNFYRGIVIRVLAVRKGKDSNTTTAKHESTTFDTIGSLFDNWD